MGGQGDVYTRLLLLLLLLLRLLLLMWPSIQSNALPQKKYFESRRFGLKFFPTKTKKKKTGML